MMLILLALLVAPALSAKLQPVPSLKTDHYIIGGSNAVVGAYPWQGSLQFRSSGSHTCGCVLISNQWVLTAAHCVGSGAATYQMYFGMHDRRVTSGPPGDPSSYNVASVIRHPNYSEDGAQGFPNDIACIRSSTTINTGSQYIAAVTMASSGDFAGQTCTISGWGRTQTGGTGNLPNILQQASVPVLSHAACSASWSQVNPNYHVCIGGSGAAGSCNGDSGGPLTCGSGTSAQLVGLTSWGITGCYTTYPSVYTRVTNYREWVRTTTGV